MSTGEPSPWSSTYAGPWQSAGPSNDPSVLAGGNLPPVNATWGTAGPPVLSDADLRQLPPPRWIPVDQRPAVIGLAACLTVTAAMLWICGLSLGWLVAAAGTRAISPTGDEGYVFHLLDSFVLRMGEGLWLPLYGFPLASVLSGFLLLARRPWTRIAHTALGLAALGWAAWWLRDSLLIWTVVTLYVGVAVAVLWTPSATRWFGRRPGRQQQTGDAAPVG